MRDPSLPRRQAEFAASQPQQQKNAKRKIVFTAAEMVEIRDPEHTWYLGVIRAIEGKNRVVHYVGWPQTWDETFTPADLKSRLRPVGAAGVIAPTGPLCRCVPRQNTPKLCICPCFCMPSCWHQWPAQSVLRLCSPVSYVVFPVASADTGCCRVDSTARTRKRKSRAPSSMRADFRFCQAIRLTSRMPH
eukprot:COSAG05_NODE_2352_length_3191_cov_212.399094_4_plen_189_part_00